MPTPLVSVIVPVYNMDEYLHEALRSILAQEYRPLELIVVDDGSDDNSLAVASSFAGIKCVRIKNGGPAVARNKGLELAEGDFVTFLDADDFWPAGRLSLQVACLLANPEAGYTVGHMSNFLEAGIEPTQEIQHELALRDLEVFCTGTLMVRRIVLEKIGVFNPSYRIGEDTDWFIRAHAAGIKKVILPSVLLNRRIHGGNLSAEPRSSRAALFRSLREAIDRSAGRQV